MEVPNSLINAIRGSYKHCLYDFVFIGPKGIAWDPSWTFFFANREGGCPDYMVLGDGNFDAIKRAWLTL